MLGGQPDEMFASVFFSSLPHKFIQLFYDPCYLSICYKGTYIHETVNYRIMGWWAQPIPLQAPLLPASVIGIVILIIRNRAHIESFLCDNAFMVAVITSGGLILGYTGVLLSGGIHLRYGYIREFMAPTWMLFMALLRAYSIDLTEAKNGNRPISRAWLNPGVSIANAASHFFPGFKVFWQSFF